MNIFKRYLNTKVIEENKILREENEKLHKTLEEWGIEGPPPIVIEKQKLGRTFELTPNSTLTVNYQHSFGGKNETLIKTDVGEYMSFDTATVFIIHDSLGYSTAIFGGVGMEKSK